MSNSVELGRTVKPIRHGIIPPAPASASNSSSETVPLTTLLKRVEQVAQGNLDVETTLREVTQLARLLTNAESASYSVHAANGEWRVVCEDGAPDNSNMESRSKIRSSHERVIRNGAAQVLRFDQTEQTSVISVPITHGMSQECVSVVLRLGSASAASFVVALQLVGNAASQAWLRQETRQRELEVQTTAAVIELQQQLGAAPNLDAACQTLAEQSRLVTGCHAVLVAWRDEASGKLKVHGVSPSAQFEQTSAFGGELQKLGEALTDHSTLHWTVDDNASRDAPLFHHAAASFAAEAILLSRLASTANSNTGDSSNAAHNANHANSASSYMPTNTSGFLLLAGAKETLARPEVAGFVRVAAAHVGNLLRMAQRAELAPREWFALRLRRSWRRGMTAVGAAMAVGGLLMIPFPYRIQGTAQIEPAERHFVVAPYAGLLKECLVKPGDEVEPGQVLARMDDSELGLELNGLEAEREKAAKKRDVSFAAQNISEKQVADSEVKRLENRIKLLQSRQKNLEIRSSVSGIVLSGDRDEVRNQPVKIGESLFEIAPTENLMVEAEIPEAEVSLMSAGSKAWVRFEGLSDQEFHGEVMRIHPRAEVRNQLNVFVAEVKLDEPSSQLRPGMSGVATVDGPSKPLGLTWWQKLRYRWWP